MVGAIGFFWYYKCSQLATFCSKCILTPSSKVKITKEKRHVFQTINKYLVRVTTLSLAVLTIKVGWIYLVPMAILVNTHRNELLPSWFRK